MRVLACDPLEDLNRLRERIVLGLVPVKDTLFVTAQWAHTTKLAVRAFEVQGVLPFALPQRAIVERLIPLLEENLRPPISKLGFGRSALRCGLASDGIGQEAREPERRPPRLSFDSAAVILLLRDI